MIGMRCKKLIDKENFCYKIINYLIIDINNNNNNNKTHQLLLFIQ